MKGKGRKGRERKRKGGRVGEKMGGKGQTTDQNMALSGTCAACEVTGSYSLVKTLQVLPARLGAQ